MVKLRWLKKARTHLASGSFLSTYVVIPLGVLSLYLAVLGLFLPTGVNKVFATRSATYAIPLTALVAVASLVLIGRARGSGQAPGVSRASLFPADLLLILLPLTPIAQYLLNNSAILNSHDIVAVASFFLLLSSLLILFVPFLLRGTGATRQLVYLGSAVAFSITNMAALSRLYAWHAWGSLKVQLPVLAAVLLAGWVMDRVGLRKAFYGVIAVYFVGNSAFQIRPSEHEEAPAADRRTSETLAQLTESRSPTVTPSIYLLVYDAYVASPVLLPHGIDNRPQEEYLEDLGFRLYPKTYSVGATSLPSMSRVLDLAHDSSGNFRRLASGNGAVVRLLEQMGYESYGVFPSDFFFRGGVPSYDVSFPERVPPSIQLTRAILEGEFRADIDFNEVTREEYLAVKADVLAQPPGRPRFVYSHSNLPSHGPFSGACRPDEVGLFAERLAEANREMRRDVETVLPNDPQAIVIVAGDHGPYLTKNCTATGENGAYDMSQITRLDIQDRLGSFLAIRWPSETYRDYDEITLLQDIFPVVLAYVFADSDILNARLEPVSLDREAVSGVYVDDGVIVGGVDDGQPLFPDHGDP